MYTTATFETMRNFLKPYNTKNPVSYRILVGVDGNYGIGKKNALPWHFKKDLQYFYKMTTTNTTKQQHEEPCVIMGKNTWCSLPYKPLKKRQNIILSRTTTTTRTELGGNCEKGENNPLVFECPLRLDHYLNVNSIQNPWVIGGESIYNFYLHYMNVDRVYMTKIHNTYDCDTFFPYEYLEKFTLQEEQCVMENDVSLSFQTYVRRENIV